MFAWQRLVFSNGYIRKCQQWVQNRLINDTVHLSMLMSPTSVLHLFFRLGRYLDCKCEIAFSLSLSWQMFEAFLCVLFSCLKSLLVFFYSYGDVTIAREGLHIYTCIRAISNELSWNTHATSVLCLHPCSKGTMTFIHVSESLEMKL